MDAGDDLRLRQREPRKGRNPKTGDKVDVPPKKVPYFKPGKELKDLINRGGEKISAEEVENLILMHPAVQNVACVPMPDVNLGERMCAFVILRAGQSLTLPTTHPRNPGTWAFQLQPGKALRLRAPPSQQFDALAKGRT